METVWIILIIAIVPGFLYYFQKKKNKKGVEEIISQVEQMNDEDWDWQVKEKQQELGKTIFKNVVTKDIFIYFGQGRFIQSGNDNNGAKFLNISENHGYKEEFYTEPCYSIAGKYDNDYYIIYFDAKPYVSLSLLQSLYLFDESKWRKVLYPVAFIDGLGYDFLDFLKLSLPERHPDDEWLKNTSTATCNRLYFKDLTAAAILNVPN
ncbi:hypothetical protein [Pedobacter miscanthi]|jgi:hypothetical protein|uniref:hypothetical protein n=1 Tax=Pedobacter miscanthi TaxID=2259170 RepID=UPI00292EF1E0|nr:hypothetical protein [Pedobacter miscanthi]